MRPDGASLLLSNHIQILRLSEIKLSWKISEIAAFLNVSILQLMALLTELTEWGALRLTAEGVCFFCSYKILNQAQLVTALRPGEHLLLWGQVVSTQQFALDHRQEGSWFYLAESQSLGRGRRGQHWHADFASSILMSYRTWVAPGFHTSAYAMLVALFWVESLKLRYPKLPLQLKWPNDIFIGDKKIAGMLVDVLTLDAGAILVFGLGCNVFSVPERQTATASFLSQYVPIRDKTALVLDLMQACRRAQKVLQTSSFSAYVQAYNDCHMLHGKKIHFKHACGMGQGCVQGVCAQGKLQIVTQTGCVTLMSQEQICRVRLTDDLSQSM